MDGVVVTTPVSRTAKNRRPSRPLLPSNVQQSAVGIVGGGRRTPSSGSPGLSVQHYPAFFVPQPFFGFQALGQLRLGLQSGQLEKSAERISGKEEIGSFIWAFFDRLIFFECRCSSSSVHFSPAKFCFNAVGRSYS